ncbi:MAG TPA: hypothetical protein VF350_06740 [Candidatus Bathyarchaeia archaeon]
MSATLNQDTNWNYRKTDQRLIVIKTKNENVRKAATLDVLTNLTFAVNVPENISMESLIPEKEYLAQLKVYTSKSLEGIDKEFINFFDALDVDQALEDFIKAYWIYPSKIRFELIDLEEP